MLRRKPPHLLLRLLLAVTGLAVLTLCVMQNVPCPVRSILGIPCPGCGMSRAWLALLQGDLAGAFRMHPMFWVVPLGVLYALWDGNLLADQRHNRLLGLGMAAGLMLCWVFRLCQYFLGTLPI